MTSKPITLFVLLLVGGIQAFTVLPVVVSPQAKSAQGRASWLDSSSNNNDENPVVMAESDQVIVGATGTVASLIMLYSEYTLKTTGCGLPAGPFGLLGAAEGVSYLGVVALVAYSIFTKFKTGSGLPAGPGGILGAAEGLSFLATVAGLVVLGFQIADYGYIPNAVPMEGGMCS